MKAVRLFLPCLLLLSFISCKKSSTSPPVTPVTAKIKSIDFGGGDIYNCEYDAQGRLTVITETTQKTEYSYPAGSKATIKIFNTAGTLTSQFNWELNGEGLGASATSILPASGAMTSIEYTSNKQISRRVQSTTVSQDKFDNRYYYAADGRLDSSIVEHTNAGGAIDNRYKLSYTYSGIKPYTIANENFGLSFLGKQTPYSYDKEVYKNLFAPSPELETNFTYEYDAQNRIIKQTRTLPPGAPQVTIYTYY